MKIREVRLESLVTVKRGERDGWRWPGARQLAGKVFWGLAAAVAAAAWYVLGCAYFS